MLRVISYNLHSGKDLFWRDRLNEMADTLVGLNADLIGLQEVHQNSRYGYQAEYLADRLGYHLAYAPALPVADGAYGNALLSRTKIIASSSMLLPARGEPRSLLRATTLGEDTPVHVWVTHCSLDRRSRHLQLAYLAQAIASHPDSNLILMGDFNTRHLDLAPLQDAARLLHLEYLSTLTAFQKRVDYILASPDLAIHSYEVIDVRWSDHYPIMATLKPVRDGTSPA